MEIKKSIEFLYYMGQRAVTVTWCAPSRAFDEEVQRINIALDFACPTERMALTGELLVLWTTKKRQAEAKDVFGNLYKAPYIKDKLELVLGEKNRTLNLLSGDRVLFTAHGHEDTIQEYKKYLLGLIRSWKEESWNDKKIYSFIRA